MDTLNKSGFLINLIYLHFFTNYTLIFFLAIINTYHDAVSFFDLVQDLMWKICLVYLYLLKTIFLFQWDFRVPKLRVKFEENWGWDYIDPTHSSKYFTDQSKKFMYLRNHLLHSTDCFCIKLNDNEYPKITGLKFWKIVFGFSAGDRNDRFQARNNTFRKKSFKMRHQTLSIFGINLEQIGGLKLG